MKSNPRFLFVLAVPLLLVPTASAAIITPIQAPTVPPLQSLGLTALQSIFLDEGLYIRLADANPKHVDQQMIAVHAALAASRFLPDQGALWLEHAKDLWNRTQVSYDASAQFYAITVPPPDQSCIDLGTNAWAILTAIALLDLRPPPPGLPTRIDQLLLMIQDVLSNGKFRGNELCNTPSRLASEPMALLALLEARKVRGDPRIDATLRSRIQQLLSSNFTAGGYREASQFSNVRNSQMLIVLTEAADAFNETSIMVARDALFQFLRDRMIVDGAAVATAYLLDETDGVVQHAGIGSPAHQIWSALALEAYDRRQPGKVSPGLVGRLIEGLLQRFWNQAEGSFVTEGGVLEFLPNGLAAAFVVGPALQSVVREAPSMSLVVSSAESFAYPGRGQPESGLTSNNWNIRFSLVGTENGAAKVVLAATDLAPMDLDPDDAVRVFRLLPTGQRGEPVPHELVAGRVDQIRFESPLSTVATPFLFEGRAPIRPLNSDFGRFLTLTLRNFGAGTLNLGNLQLDIDTTNISIQSVQFNDFIVPTTQVTDRAVTEQLNFPHLRVTLSGLVLPTGDSILRINYFDVEAPVISSVFVARDSFGANPVPTRTPVEVTQGQPVHVFANVNDNAALRQVILMYRMGSGESLQLAMEPVPGENDLFQAELQATELTETGPVLVTVRAIDSWDNLQEESVILEVENPLLVGNQVLFVFSGVLFLSSFVIWLKVRRKGLA